jgi:ABC-type transporter Mla MlaB component
VDPLVISGALGPADVAELCARAGDQLAGGGADAVVCDVGSLTRPDVATVDALARLQLVARRLGGQLELRRPTRELRALLDLCGLADVLPAGPGLRVEPLRQPEHREQAGRVEERVERGDPPV